MKTVENAIDINESLYLLTYFHLCGDLGILVRCVMLSIAHGLSESIHIRNVAVKRRNKV